MLIKKENNRGFTLVEVIVSMLVLSITIVSVLSAFVYASKSNALTKKMQASEALLEDLEEYTDAYSKSFDPEKGMDELASSMGLYTSVFSGSSCSVTTPFSDTNDVEVSTLTGVTKGSNSFTVRITRDRTPDEYLPAVPGSTGSVNTAGSIVFGETGSKTILINVDMDTFDESVRNIFHSLHATAVANFNAAQDVLEAKGDSFESDKSVMGESELNSHIQRVLRYELVHPDGNSEKVVLQGTAVYTLDSNAVYLEADASNTWQQVFYTSDEFDSLSSSNASPEHLKQIYIIYEESNYTKETPTTKVYLLDKTNQLPTTNTGSLDANVFFVCQKNSLTDLNTAVNETLGSYFGTEKLTVGVSDGGSVTPTRAELYCSAGINVMGLRPTTVEVYDNRLVAKNDNLRLITINIEVLDPDTGTVLASTKEPIACLQ